MDHLCVGVNIALWSTLLLSPLAQAMPSENETLSTLFLYDQAYKVAQITTYKNPELQDVICVEELKYNQSGEVTNFTRTCDKDAIRYNFTIPQGPINVEVAWTTPQTDMQGNWWAVTVIGALAVTLMVALLGLLLVYIRNRRLKQTKGGISNMDQPAISNTSERRMTFLSDGQTEALPSKRDVKEPPSKPIGACNNNLQPDIGYMVMRPGKSSPLNKGYVQPSKEIGSRDQQYDVILYKDVKIGDGVHTYENDPPPNEGYEKLARHRPSSTYTPLTRQASQNDTYTVATLSHSYPELLTPSPSGPTEYVHRNLKTAVPGYKTTKSDAGANHVKMQVVQYSTELSQSTPDVCITDDRQVEVSATEPNVKKRGVKSLMKRFNQKK